MLSDNPAYTLQHEWNGYKLFIPTDIASGYTMERYVEATHQQMYANSGATSDVIRAVAEDVLKRVNGTVPTETLKTDIGTLMNGLLYRLQHPVDAHCAIRVGAILSFLEFTNKDGKVISEDPEKYQPFWIEKKEGLAHDDPGMYSFFLSLGAANIPEYRELCDPSTIQDYLRGRNEALNTFSIAPLSTSGSPTKDIPKAVSDEQTETSKPQTHSLIAHSTNTTGDLANGMDS